MEKKKKLFLAAVAILTCIAGIASVFLVHYAEERDKAAEAEKAEFTKKLAEIVRNYEITLPMLRFTEEAPPSFGDVLDYFAYEGLHSAGSYKSAGVQECDLLGEYFDGESGLYRVPADITEGLICARFGVTADRESTAKDNPGRTSAAYYDETDGTYVFDGYCEFLHSVSITEQKETGNGVYELTVCKDTAVENYAVMPVYKDYVISVDGDSFKFLSVSDHEQKNTSTEPDDRKLRQIVSNYITACDFEFGLGEDISYADIFDYFMFEGVFDVNEGVVKPQMRAYCDSTGTKLSVPAYVADMFLAKRFDVTADKTSVPCYNSDTDTYDFTVSPADRMHYYNISEKSKLSSSTYVLYVVRKTYNDVTGFSNSFYRFVVEARKDEFKYLSVSKLYDHAADTSLFPVTLENSQYYSIVEKSPLEFEYTVFDKNGDPAEYAATGSSYPFVRMAGDGVVGISKVESGQPVKYRYYSQERDVFSDEYTFVYAFEGERAAYASVDGESVTVYVKNVFDASECDMTIPFDREFPSEVDIPTDCIVSMEFTEDGDLKVVYAMGDSYTQTEEIVDLG